VHPFGARLCIADHTDGKIYDPARDTELIRSRLGFDRRWTPPLAKA
jgi:hypothetical protein